MPDQHRADCMSCAGHPQIRTPNMDRLAAEGMRFANAITACPLCMPARASFIAGQYVHNHSMWTNRGELLPGEESLFRRLQENGYYTAHIGKSHYYEHRDFHMRDREPYMHSRGLDYVHETTGPWATCRTDSYMTDLWAERGYLEAFRQDYARRRERAPRISVWASPLPVELFMDSYIGSEAVRFVEDYDRQAPFALFVGFGGPHEPWDAPGDYATMYDPDQTPPPIPPADPGPWVPGYAAEWQRNGRQKAMTMDDVGRLRANYYGKITLIDHWLGRILDACERRGFLDDLLVVFWSDHGEMAGDHWRLHKSVFYEGALRIPFIIRWPGRVPARRVCDALAQTVDIMPTILEAVRATVPRTCLGKSLWPVIEGRAESVRDAAFSEIEAGGRRNIMVRTTRHKYAIHGDGTGYLLYDLAEDPGEQNNLIGHPETAELESQLRELIFRFLASAHYTRTTP